MCNLSLVTLALAPPVGRTLLLVDEPLVCCSFSVLSYEVLFLCSQPPGDLCTSTGSVQLMIQTGVCYERDRPGSGKVSGEVHEGDIQEHGGEG